MGLDVKRLVKPETLLTVVTVVTVYRSLLQIQASGGVAEVVVKRVTTISKAQLDLEEKAAAQEAGVVLVLPAVLGAILTERLI